VAIAEGRVKTTSMKSVNLMRDVISAKLCRSPLAELLKGLSDTPVHTTSY